MFDRRIFLRLGREFRELMPALGTGRFFGTLLATAAGCVAGSLSINGVLIPRNLFAPGTSGSSLLIFYLTGWPSLGVFYLLLNIPILVIGWREYALKCVAIPAFGVLAS